MPNNLLLCCGVQPIRNLIYEGSERNQNAYSIRCERCGRVAVENFTEEDTWPEAREKAREKWNRSIVEEIKEKKDG